MLGIFKDNHMDESAKGLIYFAINCFVLVIKKQFSFGGWPDRIDRYKTKLFLKRVFEGLIKFLCGQTSFTENNNLRI